MVKMSVTYRGEKRCELIHEPSLSQIETDAPRDNHGRGECFSPTDLMGAALASCVLTTMAIMAEKEGLNLQGAQAHVIKEMNPNPRRIARLPVQVIMPAGLSTRDRTRLEAAARTCPVHRSLNPEIDAQIEFIYPDQARDSAPA